MSVSTTAFNEEQRRAIEAGGVVFVSAGAGTGKTRVLVERFARAVLDRGLSPDKILAITYTERAAAELAARIRLRLDEEGEGELARALDGAWISTIHGFCGRILRRHALQAGLDPAFVVLDPAAADLMRAESYDTALREMAKAREDVLDLVTAYGEDRLRTLIDGTHERLRTAGHPLRFDPAPAASLPDAIDKARTAALALARTLGPGVRLEESRARALALAELLEHPPHPSVLAALPDHASRGRLEVAGDYDAALAELERAARDAVFEDLRPLLDELLQAFANEYAGRKRSASCLDFDDLQLEARRVLTERDDVRADLQQRFAEVMVDEFQDTNELQAAIVDAVAGPEATLFFVGDEFQSIYRFRHADVDVFRRRRDEVREGDGEGAISLRTNYRSRPEVLAVVNHLFGDAFGPTYEPLQPSDGAFPELAPDEPAVEFLVTDASGPASEIEPRDAEAAMLAKRIAQLVAEGACSAGDVVLLFSAGTDAARYEQALQAAGLDTVSATGRKYFEAQPVRDITAYLRLIRNRYDDAAFLAVIASPLVGVSNDTLARLRTSAPKRPLYTSVENGIPTTVDADDGRRLAAFRQRFDRLVEAAGRSSLGALVERIVDDHDYDLALLANPYGPRRLANVRKLARLAREFEALRGPDLEGFLETVEVRRLAADREPDALVSEEDADAVRLMTVHAAKGLQFRVVVVADAGRSAAGRSDHLVALPDGRVGIKVPDAVGQLRETSAFTAASGIDALAEDAERRRVSYVALTRAVERLIISGVVRGGANEETPIAWMLRRLGASPSDGDQAIGIPGASVSVRVGQREIEAEAEAIAEPAPVEPVTAKVAGQLAFFDSLSEVEPLPPPVAVDVPPPLVPLPEAPPERPGRLSFSALSLFERCGYRFYAERLLGFRSVDRSRTPGGTGLDGAELGTVVHDTLEHPGRGVDVALARFPHATEADAERAAALVAVWERSPLAARVAALEARREVPFLVEAGGAQIAGRLDLLARDGTTGLVIDYKSNRVTDSTPTEMRDAGYALQEAVYALALLEHGHEEVEVHFAFLDADEAVMRRFTQADAGDLRARVAAAVAASTTGPYVPRPGVVCEDCPVLGLLCAGPDLDALHAAPDAY